MIRQICLWKFDKTYENCADVGGRKIGHTASSNKKFNEHMEHSTFAMEILTLIATEKCQVFKAAY